MAAALRGEAGVHGRARAGPGFRVEAQAPAPWAEPRAPSPGTHSADILIPSSDASRRATAPANWGTCVSVSGWAGRTLLAVCGTAWAGLMVVGGLWAMTEWTARFPTLTRPLVLGGLMFVGMGEFVFAVIVADRLIPGVSQRVSGAVELTAGLIWGTVFVVFIVLVAGAVL